MKRTALAFSILLSLAGPTAVLAEVPLEQVKPLVLEAVPAAAETAAGEAMPAAAAAEAAAVQEQLAPAAAAESTPAAAETAAPMVELPTEAPAAGGEAAAAPAAAAAVPEAVADAPETAAAAAAMPGKPPCPMHGMGKGMGPGGMGMMGGDKPGCDKRGKFMSQRHAEVVQRLDMIEARMAKIEAMLESLMKREQED